jgi:hypothetical protein
VKVRLIVPLLACLLLAVAWLAISCGGSLSLERRQELDGLDAESVARLYLETTDPAVVSYLSAPELQSLMSGANHQGETRHDGDIRNLTVTGPANVQTDRPLAQTGTSMPVMADAKDQSVTEMFTADYELVKVRQPGTEEPGQQVRFIYVARQTPSSPWRVLELGTGP